MHFDREERLVDVVLEDGTGHRVNPWEPDQYEIDRFKDIRIALDPDSVFPRDGPRRGYLELTIPELQAEAERLRRQDLSPHRPIMTIHQKFSIPVACLVFGVIGLALGVTSPEGRQAGQLRPRHQCHIRLLRDHVYS